MDIGLYTLSGVLGVIVGVVIGIVVSKKSKIPLTFIVIIFVFLILAILLYFIPEKYKIYFRSFSDTYGTFVLVIVTAIYVILTWGMIGEMRKQRETQFEPWLEFYVTLTRNKDNFIMIIENTGAGPAKNACIECDPDITYPPDPNKKLSEAFGIIKRIAPNVHISKNLTYSLYIPGFSERPKNFLGLDVLIDELKKYNFKFNVTVHWEDNFGNPYKNPCQIDLHKYLQ